MRNEWNENRTRGATTQFVFLPVSPIIMYLNRYAYDMLYSRELKVLKRCLRGRPEVLRCRARSTTTTTARAEQRMRQQSRVLFGCYAGIVSPAI